MTWTDQYLCGIVILDNAVSSQKQREQSKWITSILKQMEFTCIFFKMARKTDHW